MNIQRKSQKTSNEKNTKYTTYCYIEVKGSEWIITPYILQVYIIYNIYST